MGLEREAVRKIINKTLKDLVLENKRELLSNAEELEKIELRLEERHLRNY
jgi:hypothetical protein